MKDFHQLLLNRRSYRKYKELNFPTSKNMIFADITWFTRKNLSL